MTEDQRSRLLSILDKPLADCTVGELIFVALLSDDPDNEDTLAKLVGAE